MLATGETACCRGTENDQDDEALVRRAAITRRREHGQNQFRGEMFGELMFEGVLLWASSL